MFNEILAKNINNIDYFLESYNSYMLYIQTSKQYFLIILIVGFINFLLS